MKNFLKELYDNFPELENSKEKVDKAVYYLKDNKPFYAASDEFKTKLKTRLENIVSLTSKKKSNFFIFAIPVFSFLFIVVWFSYYFKDISFLNDKTNISIWTPIEDSSMKMQVVNSDVIEETFIELWDDSTMSNYIKFNDNKPKDIINNNSYKSKTKNITFVQEQNVTSETEKIDDNLENNDIVDIFWALWEIYPESDKSIEIPYWYVNSWNIWWMPDNKDFTNNPNLFMNDMLVISENEMSFEDYCYSNSWTILQSKSIKLCKFNDKYCLSNSYINGSCDIKEIK